MKLRSIELALPDPAGAARFMLDIWGMAPGDVRGDTHYLRGSGPYPYLVAFEKADAEFAPRPSLPISAAAPPTAAGR